MEKPGKGSAIPALSSQVEGFVDAAHGSALPGANSARSVLRFIVRGNAVGGLGPIDLMTRA